MRKLAVIIAMLATSFSAQAGFNPLTTEDVVVAVLTSQELSQEKATNALLASLPLQSIDVEAGDGVTIVSLHYSDGGAPCSVRAEVKGVDATPPGAAGINIKAEIVLLASACAMYN